MVENNDLRKTLLDEMDRAEENLKDLEVQFLEMPNPFADEVCTNLWPALDHRTQQKFNFACLAQPTAMACSQGVLYGFFNDVSC